MSPPVGPESSSPDSAPLSAVAASALLVLYTLIYVLPLYGSAGTRPSPTLSRDHPAVIRARVKSVRASTAVCLATTFFILRSFSHDALLDPLHVMGLWPVGFRETATSLLLTVFLFAAPLYETILLDGLWEAWATLQPLKETWHSLTTWRNIVVGPITEELLFRSASVPLLLLAHLSLSKTIFLSPVIFGLAHFHHFYEFRITHPGVSLPVSIARSVLQFTYTTLFGAYATFLFIRTGSLLAATVAHAFCNSIGLPRFWGSVQPYWINGPTVQAATRKWTLLYYALLFAGTWVWWKTLTLLTDSKAALVNMDF